MGAASRCGSIAPSSFRACLCSSEGRGQGLESWSSRGISGASVGERSAEESGQRRAGTGSSTVSTRIVGKWRTSQPGAHQFAVPISSIAAGTRTRRTTVASMKTASSRKERTSTARAVIGGDDRRTPAAHPFSAADSPPMNRLVSSRMPCRVGSAGAINGLAVRILATARFAQCRVMMPEHAPSVTKL